MRVSVVMQALRQPSIRFRYGYNSLSNPTQTTAAHHPIIPATPGASSQRPLSHGHQFPSSKPKKTETSGRVVVQLAENEIPQRYRRTVLSQEDMARVELGGAF
eukprot:TRINITY_DN733_c0_g4_i1.p1 TRINITY_DN733_c0_g4~~TRINITY_DN733_c0_g4_i1.p1  ORF type:complete len:103 (+),score=16.93 TRINITY_DN733_c0_g4_i1:53-361(+)